MTIKYCTATISTGKNKGTICSCKVKRTTGNPILGLCGRHYTPPKAIPTAVIPPRRIISMPHPTGAIDHYIHVGRIYPEQHIAGQQIRDHFNSGIHFVALCAPCQSGKSNVQKHVFALMSDLDHIPFLFIPVNDNDILAQTRREFGGYCVPENILSLPQMREPSYLSRLIAKYPGKKFTIIIDESHMGATLSKGKETSSIFNCLTASGIWPNATRIKSNCYILTVSATPNAEISSLCYERIRTNKKVVKLQPGANYYGIEDMIREGRVFESFSLKTDSDTDRLVAILSNYVARRKYAIIRVTSIKHGDDLALIVNSRLDIKHVSYDSDHTKDSELTNILQSEPAEFTVIFIVQRCRASMQLDSTHICMVFENAGAETDTTTQGLPGRMCGYNKRSHLVDVYCSKESLHNQLNWMRSGFSYEAVPSCKSVSGGVKSKELRAIWRPCVPETGTISEDFRDIILDELHRWGPDKLRSAFYHIIKTRVYEELHLDAALAIKGSGIMVLKDHNDSYKKFWLDKTPNVVNGKPHMGFETTKISSSRTQGFFVYINMVPGPDFGKYRIYQTQRYAADETRTKPSMPNRDNIYHPDNSPAPQLIRILPAAHLHV